MQSFTFYPNNTFMYQNLPAIAESLGVTFKINQDLSITFSSDNDDLLEEAYDHFYWDENGAETDADLRLPGEETTPAGGILIAH